MPKLTELIDGSLVVVDRNDKYAMTPVTLTFPKNDKHKKESHDLSIIKAIGFLWKMRDNLLTGKATVEMVIRYKEVTK